MPCKVILNKRNIKTTFTPQHDQADCGVACLVSLARFYGGDTSLEQVRNLSGTSQQGTTLLGLYQAALALGFIADGYEADTPSLKSLGKPAILLILDERNAQHFVICYEYSNGRFTIGNPAKGIEYWDDAQLAKHWISKACLVLEPSDGFKKKKDVQAQKKQWIKGLIKDDINTLTISILIGIVLAGLSMAMAVFSQRLIDGILPSKDYPKLVTALVLLLLLMLIQVIFSVVRQRLLLQQAKDFNNRIITKFYSKLLFLPKSFFDSRKVGDLTARLNDSRRIQSFIVQVFGSSIISVLSIGVSLVVIFLYSWQLALPILCSLPLYFFIIYRYNSHIIAKQREVMASYAQSESNFISTIQGVATIKNLNKQGSFSSLNRQIYGFFQDRIFMLGKLNISISWQSNIVSVCFLVMLLSLGSFFVIDEKLTLGRFMAILSISSTLLPSIASLAMIAIPFNEAKVAFDRMFELASVETGEDEADSSSEKCNIETLDHLEVKNICFRFAGRPQLLSNISLKISKGEIVSIAGESGCGKSTFCQILQKFYEVELGDIVVNKSIPLQQLPAYQWRRIIGVVPQDVYIFNGTVLENICLEELEAANVKQVIDFCKLNGFSKYIEQLPQGYMTTIGEEGINLSGGQKQIIAIIRALFKKPQLLILDEATAAMDRETERFVLDLLLQIKERTTVVFISHRLHILKTISDRIYLFEKGKVAGEGTHDELCQSVNLYSSYWQDLQ